jgi:DNA-binding response OmpR family regulator
LPRILVIEDDAQLRQMLAIALGKAGHEVVECADGRKAISAHETRPVDLVITDLIMPEMEGIETIRRLRQLSPTVPIIAISGGGRVTADSYLSIARRMGATKILSKPFELNLLCAMVAELLA